MGCKSLGADLFLIPPFFFFFCNCILNARLIAISHRAGLSHYNKSLRKKNTSLTYQRKEVKKRISILPDNVETFAAQINEILVFLRRFIAAINYVNHVGS